MAVWEKVQAGERRGSDGWQRGRRDRKKAREEGRHVWTRARHGRRGCGQKKMRVLLGGPGWQAEEVSYPWGGEETFV